MLCNYLNPFKWLKWLTKKQLPKENTGVFLTMINGAKTIRLPAKPPIPHLIPCDVFKNTYPVMTNQIITDVLCAKMDIEILPHGMVNKILENMNVCDKIGLGIAICERMESCQIGAIPE